MKISNIKLENFKCLKDQSLDLRNLNLLTGINSAGKSSLIQSLLLLKQSSLEDTLFKFKLKTLASDFFNSFPNENNIIFKSLFNHLANYDPENASSKLVVKGKYTDIGNPDNLLFLGAENDTIIIQLTSESNTNLKIVCDLKDNNSSDSISCTIESPEELDLNIFNNKSFQYLNAERMSPKTFYPYSTDIIENNDIGINGEYTAHFLASNKNNSLLIEALKHPDTVTNQLLENTSAWLSKISKGIDINVESNKELKQAQINYTYNNNKPLFPQNIGFGITYVLPIIVSILKSKPDDLIIIENPESHLHPAGQAEIGRLCAVAANSGVQIILETHSDHVLNGVRVATKEKFINPDKIKIYYFEKPYDKLETLIHSPNIDEKGIIDHWPKGFFDEWDNQLDKLLW